MRRTLLHIVVGLGLLVGLIAGAIATTSAAPDEPGQPTLFFPWVPNDDDIAGIEGVTGSITIQNLEIFPVAVTITDADYNELTSITLNPRASQNWTADQLGIDAPGSGVIVSADWADVQDLFDAGLIFCDVEEVTGTRGTPENTTDTITGVGAAPTFVEIQGYREGADFTWRYSGGTLFIHWNPPGAEPSAGTQYTVSVYSCDDIPLPRIAGVEKHTVGTTGVRTTANTAMVDGYSAIPVFDLTVAADAIISWPEVDLDNQSRWVIPIVQTNNHWNTEIVITNVSGQNTSVNATFFPAGGQGFAGESVALLSGAALGPGESIAVDLREDAGFPDEQVGSVWIDATHAVVAAAFRNKPSTEMMLTTVAQPRTDNPVVSPTLKYGPLVFRDYNGWNTGINIANLSSATNQVSVTYYSYGGNVVHVDTINIPSRAMEYVYTPATGSFGIGENQITAVRIQGTAPLAAAIDEVKYLSGQDQWHAMSYAAGRAQDGGRVVPTADSPVNGRTLYESMLGLPLVQKGNPATGYGDTSGINLFNPGEDSVEVWVQFVDSAGVPVAPTREVTDAEKPLSFPMPAGSGATIYTLSLSEMVAGFQGSAVVGVVGDGALVGVSNNVNYAVGGDGSAVFNLAVTPQATPRFAVDFDVDWGESPNPVNDENGDPVSHTVTVTVRDLFGDPAPNVRALLRVTSGPNAGLEVSGTTGANGQAALSYTNDDGELGTDQLEVWVDLDRDGVVDADETETGTKEWVTGLYRVVSVTPEEATNLLGAAHTVTVTVHDGSPAENPIAGATVVCEVAGANEGAEVTYSDADQLTDANGQIECTYTGENAGEDTITATVDGAAGSATKIWLDEENVDATTTVNGWPGPEGNPVLVPLGATVPVETTVTYNGDPVEGLKVCWDFNPVIDALGDLAELCAYTDSNGVASTTFTAALALDPSWTNPWAFGAYYDVNGNEEWDAPILGGDDIKLGDAVWVAVGELSGSTTVDGQPSPDEGNPVLVPLGATVPVETTVMLNGNPVEGLKVCWDFNPVIDALGDLAELCAYTDSNGVASTTFTAALALDPSWTNPWAFGAYYDVNGNEEWNGPGQGGPDIKLGDAVWIQVEP